MGNTWSVSDRKRQLSETVKQKWGLTAARNFRPTSNARNEAMFMEATKFANQLTQFEKDLRIWQESAEASFSVLHRILSDPLPMVQDGQREHDLHLEPLQKAAAESNMLLETIVFKPFQDWIVAYRTIQKDMKTLEELRLILDSRRRTLDNLRGKEEQYRKVLTGTPGEKGEMDLKKTQHKAMHKLEKMQSVGELFCIKEQTVYNSLFKLLKDTASLQCYAAYAFMIMQVSFSEASEAFMEDLPYPACDDTGLESDQVLVEADCRYLNRKESTHCSEQGEGGQPYSPGYLLGEGSTQDCWQEPSSPYKQDVRLPGSLLPANDTRRADRA